MMIKMKKREFLFLVFLVVTTYCTRYQIPGVIKDIMKRENIVLVPATTEDIRKALFKDQEPSKDTKSLVNAAQNENDNLEG